VAFNPNLNLWKTISKDKQGNLALIDIDKEIHFHNQRIQTLSKLQKNIPKSSSLFKFREYLKKRHLREIKKLNSKKQVIKL